MLHVQNLIQAEKQLKSVIDGCTEMASVDYMFSLYCLLARWQLAAVITGCCET